MRTRTASAAGAAGVLLGFAATVPFGGCIEDAVLVSAAAGGSGGSSVTSTTGQGGATSTSTGSGTGGVVGCTDPRQCPGEDTTCRWRTCEGDVCGVDYAAEAVPCTEGGNLCDGMGNCVECTMDEHCVGEPCVNFTCGLKLPNGDPCTDDAECQSGHCPTSDGVCCDFACDGPCESCAGAKTCGQDGTCAPIAAGTDPDSECQGSNACFGSSCQTGKIVFTTSIIYNGNLGGLSGADTLCQNHAAMACLPGSYMAWLSTNQDSPSTRFMQSTVAYRRVDGALIANNWNDLVDGMLDVPINLDERGNPAPLSQISGGCQSDLAYSGTAHDGTAHATAANRCNDWTSTTAEGTWGEFGVTNSLWSQYCTGSSGGTCAAKAAIYCFEQ